MFKTIKAFLKKHISFSKDFVHPIINQKLSDAIDAKIVTRKKEQDKETDIHKKVLNSYLITFFQKQYTSITDQQLAFDTANRGWVKYCRDENSKSKLINLNKKAFENQCRKVFETAKQNKDGNKK